MAASVPSSDLGRVELIPNRTKLYETETRSDLTWPRAGCGIAMDQRARGATSPRSTFRWLHRSQGARLDQGLPKGSYGIILSSEDRFRLDFCFRSSVREAHPVLCHCGS
jgi:hypothetical protein